jgi:PKD repeat protein
MLQPLPFLIIVCVVLPRLIPLAKSAQNFGIVTASEDSWPMFQHDMQHSGYTESQIPSTIRQKWNFTTFGMGAIVYPPIVSDSMVFFGSMDGNFYALNETNGDVNWFRPLGPNSASAAVDATRELVFVAVGSVLYALDEATGSVKWTKTAEFDVNYPTYSDDRNTPWYSPPVVDTDNGILFIGGMRYWVDPPDKHDGLARSVLDFLSRHIFSGNVSNQSAV